MLTPSMFKASFPERHSVQNVACEQALQGTLATGREKEGELATTSLEFKHRKSWCGVLLIGRDDISNDVNTLGVCFHVFSNVFFYIRTHFSFTLNNANLTAQLTGSHWGIQIPET